MTDPLDALATLYPEAMRLHDKLSRVKDMALRYATLCHDHDVAADFLRGKVSSLKLHIKGARRSREKLPPTQATIDITKWSEDFLTQHIENKRKECQKALAEIEELLKTI